MRISPIETLFGVVVAGGDSYSQDMECMGKGEILISVIRIITQPSKSLII